MQQRSQVITVAIIAAVVIGGSAIFAFLIADRTPVP